MTAERHKPLDLGALERSLEEHHRDLLAQILQLTADEIALAESRDEEGGAMGDLGDIASDLVEQEIDQALEEGARLQLREVDAALKRIVAREYGNCEDCGEPIDAARLTARPWARRCLPCQQAAERRGRRR